MFSECMLMIWPSPSSAPSSSCGTAPVIDRLLFFEIIQDSRTSMYPNVGSLMAGSDVFWHRPSTVAIPLPRRRVGRHLRVLSTASLAGDHLHIPQVSSAAVGDDEDLVKRHGENVVKVKRMLARLPRNSREGLVLIDRLKQLSIDHHFTEEINSVLEETYNNYCNHDDDKQQDNLFDHTLSFRLLRQSGYPVTPDQRMGKFMKNGNFRGAVGNDVDALLSLFEASHLNIGCEEILYKANEFSTENLKNSLRTCTKSSSSSYIGHVLRHPNHLNPPNYNAHYNLHYLRATGKLCSVTEKLAVLEYQLNQAVHMEEFQTISRWKRNLRLEEDMPQVRSEVATWYPWSMATFSKIQCISDSRIWYTKIIGLIYIIDDIFDVIGSSEELSLFVDALKRWNLSTVSSLPAYMKVYYATLYSVTNEIAEMIERKHGWNPIDTLRKLWVGLADAAMLQHKWFSTKYRPRTEEYVEIGLISSGMLLVFVYMFLLLGQGITRENLNAVQALPPIFNAVSKIMRFADDLVSDKDEGVELDDGSYMEYYMEENPGCSMEEARRHTQSCYLVHGKSSIGNAI